jgi:hypothetical protein
VSFNINDWKVDGLKHEAVFLRYANVPDGAVPCGEDEADILRLAYHMEIGLHLDLRKPAWNDPDMIDHTRREVRSRFPELDRKTEKPFPRS